MIVEVQRECPHRLISLPLSPCQLLGPIQAQMLEGEDVLQAAERLLIAEAIWLSEDKSQRGAGKILGVHNRRICHKMDNIEKRLLKAQEC